MPATITRTHVETTHPAVALGLVEGSFRPGCTSTGLRDAASGAFLSRARSAESDSLAVHDIAIGGTGGADTDGTSDAFVAHRLRAGWMHVDAGPRLGSATAGPGEVVLIPESRPFRTDWSRPESSLVRIPMPAMRDVAEEITGVRVSRVRLLGLDTASPRLTPVWRATADMLLAQMLRPGGPAENPLVRTALVRTAVGAALTVFPNTAVDDHLAPNPGRVDPRVCYRAMSWLDDHAHEPVTAALAAAAVGTTTADLRAAMLAVRGMTPTAYLRAARLELARHDLRVQPVADRALEQVATRWGFLDQHDFRRAYERAFHRTPDTEQPVD